MTTAKKIEFGDFQTPRELARETAVFLHGSGEAPDVIIEPTCGEGSFILAAIDAFPHAHALYGYDINSNYIEQLRDTVLRHSRRETHIECGNFFELDWKEFLSKISGNILIIGNPPWVTNTALGILSSENVPQKSNFQCHNGFAAKTGKANFDISEWMLIKLMEALNGRRACIAMLCKTSTARKSLRHAWLSKHKIGRCSIHRIDAQKHFGVSVDACLLVVHTGESADIPAASVYSDLSFNCRLSTLGLTGKELVADMDNYLQLKEFDGVAYYTWRSGVKHDAAGVMEFTLRDGNLVNGFDEKCEIEPTHLFPLLKSSDIANSRLRPEKLVLLTQRRPSDDTGAIMDGAPLTWEYLMGHSSALDKRRSIIYRKRPRFSVFGIGDYTFSPWKVAISGLYKTCQFQVVGQFGGKAIVLDDTCYFISCESEVEAQFVSELLNSDICQRFLHSLIFFDAKRPITIDILNRIDLMRIAERLNRGDTARKLLCAGAAFEDKQPLLVFEENGNYQF